MNKGILSLLALSLVLIVSCKKDKDETEKPSIIGLWKGKYGSSTSYPNAGYAFLFRTDGTVRVFDGVDTAAASKAEGTYSVSGSSVSTKYTYTGGSTYSTAATIDPKMTFIEGSWGSGTNTTNGGKFFIVKQ
jgi:hypothetical protein